MTEADWLSCGDPDKMLAHVQGKASDRKLRLFACACCRQIWHLITDERSRQAVEVAERYAEGEATDQELAAAWSTARDAASIVAWSAARDAAWSAAREAARAAAWEAAREAARAAAWDATWVVAGKVQAGLLREIVGNPFRPVEASFLVIGRDEVVHALAQRIHDEQDYSAMPVLADALEDAGCTEESILRHCRGEELCPLRSAPTSKCPECKGTGWRPLSVPHCRGCWAIDLILGNE